MDSVEFFDCHVCYGPTDTFLKLSDPEALIAHMERVGTGKALVYYEAAVCSYLLEVNKRLIRELAPYPQLMPA